MESSAGYRISFIKKQRNKEKVIEVINNFFDKQDYLEDWQKDNFKITSSDGKIFDPEEWDLPISIEDYEGLLLKLSKEVAASFPNQSFTGKSVITDLSSGWRSFDSVKYEEHSLQYLSISTEQGEDVICPECGEVLVSLGDVIPGSIIKCDNCGYECQPVELENLVEDALSVTESVIVE